MSDKNNKTIERDETDADRLRRSASREAVSVGLVSAFAGDREPNHTERQQIRLEMAARGRLFFSDLLYALTHVYFAPQVAEPLWEVLLVHKHEMSRQLGRNVRIVVATLDYLSNIRDDIALPTLISEAYISEIASLSMRDGMTGLYNHSTFYELLEMEFVSHRRHGSSVALILLDVDDFKAVNDRFGHLQGDRVLVQLAQTLRAVVREADICCRFGGEEFAVIMPFTDSYTDALVLGERIRAAAANMTSGDKGHQGVTISVGVAVFDERTTSPGELVDLADRALYTAKTRGKNQVVTAKAQRGGTHRQPHPRRASDEG